MNAALPARAPRRFLLTLRLGEMPEHIPSLLACRRYGIGMAERVDGGAIDRLLRHHGGAARITRLHNARTPHDARPDVPGARRYDDIEQLSGVARVLRVEVAEDAGLPPLVDALAQLHAVERVTPDRICRTPFRSGSDTEAGSDAETRQWRPREMIRLPQALGYEPGDASVVIGLADTGVLEAAELGARLHRGFDTVDLNAGVTGGLELTGDSAGPDQEPEDEVGHGTGCAGIIAAFGQGMPPGAGGDCRLVPARVLGSVLGSGGKRLGIGALANIDAGMKRLVDLGVKVINMSFGTPESALATADPRPHEEVVRYALARGVILVAASGNSGIEERYYPAAHEGVIAVGAVDDDRQPSSFSTRGAHVALCAPGRGIHTCGLDGGYQSATGTSFASPFVAAVCGLLAARATRRAWPLTPALVRELLVGSVQPFAQAGVEGCGVGVLDALAALQALDARIDAALEQEAADWAGLAA